MKKLIFSENFSLPLRFRAFFDFIVANKTFRLEESILKVSAPKIEKITKNFLEKNVQLEKMTL